MTKVKIISSIHIKTLEDAINDFIADRSIHDIKYRTTYEDRGSRITYSAMIIYKEIN